VTDWLSLLRRNDHKAIAQALIDEAEGLDLPYLREEPWGAISEMPTLSILELDTLPGMCGGGGYYDHRSRTIYLHPSGRRRNNFTLLHELGHYVQRRHSEWSMVLLDDVHEGMRRKVEEAVSDHFAAAILLSACEDLDLDPFVTSPALVASVLFSNSMASRSAALRHVGDVLRHGAKWVLAVADLEGRVIYAQCTYDQFPPKRGMVQPGFSRLAEEARDGLVRRAFSEGMVYQGGRELHEMKAEAVLDFEGTHVFVALTPIHRFGQGKIERVWHSCSNHGCETEDFAPDALTEWCTGTCREPKCPTCGRCRCGGRSGAHQCPNCWIEVTAYEAAHNLHEC
jgi:hypothetical protein